jgi:cation diffusion facilitator CzcD-associated flavoprotein CzcO
VFDDNTATWTLSTDGGEPFRGRIVIATHRPVYVPWIPDFAAHNDFQGQSFHAAAWDPAFDPAGKRIAVVGTDAAAGHYLDRLVQSAASVTVFGHAPRRVVSEVPRRTTRAKRWLSRHTRGRQVRRAPLVAESAIDVVTPSGIRTDDGVDHRADTIIYGTGFAIPDQMPDQVLVGARGLTIQQAWEDGMEPFLGVAVHGFPNYFFISGPDIGAQIRYVVECLDLMRRTASTRIEVRRSSQQVFNERAQLKPAPPHQAFKAFDLSPSARDDDDTYDGAATLEIGGSRHSVHVRLTGHLDPIDGNYHWQGTVLDRLPSLKQARAGTLTVGERSAPARIIEQTPWGTHSVAGVGTPPYA